MITLRQLRYLEALADTRHFGNAADLCAISQPALSMQIKELEDELQVSLVERRKSGVVLTEQGEEVVRRGRTILASVRDLVAYTRHRGALLSGPLRLGAIPSIAPYLLPAALPQLQQRFPELSLHLRETMTDALVRELVSGELDLILVALPINETELEALPLFQDKFVLAAPAGAEGKRKRATASELLDKERLLLLEEGHCLRDQALSFCRLVSPEARESFGASSLATIVQMVAYGHGVTLLPELAVASEAHHRGDIRLLRFPAPEPSREIGLVWRKTSPRKEDFAALAGLLKEVAPRGVKI
jgi:LysR family hydrogen peroxide-inducible transcriptional activator